MHKVAKENLDKDFLIFTETVSSSALFRLDRIYSK